VLLLRNKRTNTLHKYKCIPHKGGHECVVDDQHGTCSTPNCCGFNCNNGACEYSCTGKYANANECAATCGGSKFYGCVDNKCVPTTSVSPIFENEPCCGEPCTKACEPNPATTLKTLSEGIFKNPGTKPNWGQRMGVQLSSVKQNMRMAVTTDMSAIIYDVAFSDTDNSVTLGAQLGEAFTACRTTGTSITVGNDGQSFVFLAFNSFPCASMEITSSFLYTLPITNPDAGPTTVSQNLSSAIAADDYEYMWINPEIGLVIGKGTFPQTVPFEGGPDQPNSLSPGSLNNANVVTCIAAQAGVDELDGFFFLTYNTSTEKATQTAGNPIVGGAPKGATNFGQLANCSKDSSVLLVAADKAIYLFSLDNPNEPDLSKWMWKHDGMVPTKTNVTNVCVSNDGKILAWTTVDTDYITVSAKLDTVTGFSQTTLLSVSPAQTDPLGVGGLFVIPLKTNVYAVFSASGNAGNTASKDEVYQWVVEIQT